MQSPGEETGQIIATAENGYGITIMTMKIEGILNWTTPGYWLIVPSLCVYYDREEEVAGVAFMWLNIIVGAQVSKKKVTIKNNND